MKTLKEPVVALVVAAGSGSRLGGSIPKALVEIDGRPLVGWSVEALAAGGCQRAVVVVAADLVDTFRDVLADAPVPVEVVVGGARRQDSVAHGLAAAGESGIVLVHDAARPFVPAVVVARVVEGVAAGNDCVIPAVPVVDTIRQLDGEGSHTVDRSSLVAVQTPQGFDLATLREAHAEAARRGLEVTDDAGILEALGHRIQLVEGARDALKVTEPLDVDFARAIRTARTTAQEA